MDTVIDLARRRQEQRSLARETRRLSKLRYQPKCHLCGRDIYLPGLCFGCSQRGHTSRAEGPMQDAA